MLLWGKSRSKSINISKGAHQAETRTRQAETERRAAKARIDTCLAPGLTVDSLEEGIIAMHTVAASTGGDGVPGTLKAMRSGLAVWKLLQHAHNTSKVRQQRRRRDKLKRNFDQRVARMISVKVPEMVMATERAFAEAVRANLTGSGLGADATDAEMSAAMEQAIRAGAHLTRTVKMEPRSQASRAAEKKGSLRQEWGRANRPQMDKAQLPRSNALGSKVHVSCAHACTACARDC